MVKGMGKEVSPQNVYTKPLMSSVVILEGGVMGGSGSGCSLCKTSRTGICISVRKPQKTLSSPTTGAHRELALVSHEAAPRPNTSPAFAMDSTVHKTQTPVSVDIAHCVVILLRQPRYTKTISKRVKRHMTIFHLCHYGGNANHTVMRCH